MAIVSRRGRTSVREKQRAAAPLAFSPGTAIVLGLLALLAVVAIRRELARTRDVDVLLSAARRAGLDGAAVELAERRARREPDPGDRRIAIASELLRREHLSRDPASEASLGRLVAARALALEALAAQPASFEAAMIVGATVSLERSRSRDTRIFSLAADWERPLTAALALAPGAARPRQLLAAAYLEVWPALSPEKRKLAGELLREALSDREMFERLFDPWVATAGSLAAAAELLPDEPESWRRLARTALGRGAWGDHARLVDRFRAALAREIRGGLELAERGERGRPPAEFWHRALAEAPLDAEFAPLVERALALRPPGPAVAAEAAAADAWFRWASPLCLVNDCPLSGAALTRLAFLAGSHLAPEQMAFAALVAGDRPRADLFERRSESLWSEAWGPYLTLKSARLLTAGDRAGAREALASTHRAFRARASWRRLAAASALSAGALPAGLPPLERDRWEASDWWFERGASRLDLVPVRGAGALLIDPQRASASEALLEVVWNGRRLPLVVVPAREGPGGGTAIRLPLSPPAAASRPALLEVRILRGDLRPAMPVRLE
jgi:hypothetical protein